MGGSWGERLGHLGEDVGLGWAGGRGIGGPRSAEQRGEGPPPPSPPSPLPPPCQSLVHVEVRP